MPTTPTCSRRVDHIVPVADSGFPIASLLVGLGGLQTVLSLRGQAEAPLSWRWRPLFILLASVAIFILAAPTLGLAIAGLALVFLSSVAGQEFRWREALLVGVLVGGAAAALFIQGLGVPLPVWPPFLVGD